MELAIGLFVILLASLFVRGAIALIERLRAPLDEEVTTFDQYPLPDSFDEEAAAEARLQLGIKD